MKRRGYILLVLFVLLMLASGFGLLSVSALQPQPEGAQSQEHTRTSEDMNAYRSSNILGSAVQNNQGEDIGSIDDMVINVDNGEIAYAVMNSAGFLGLGAKSFSIPWDELEAQPQQGIFMLNISIKQLEETPGLSEGNWPGIGNRQWGMNGQQDQQLYGSQGILETVPGQTRISEDMNAYRSSNILGSAVQNNQGEDIGSIDELIIDMDNGEIAYAVMNNAGFLGIGAKSFAIPWDELEAQPQQGIFMLNISKQQLEEAPGLSEGNWPGIGNRQWGEGGQQDQQVSIEQNAFNPAEIEVQPGTTVTWNNLDSAPHTVTSGASSADDAGELFDSETLETQQKYEKTFDEPGEYTYFCRFHPEMQGIVIISE